MSGSDLFQQALKAWKRHVEFDHEGKYVIVICWTLMTYVYLVFTSLPFLHLLGPKGTGKSQTLDVLNQLVRQGHKSQVTAPSVGDLIQTRRVTVLFDQADNLKPEHVDLFTDSYRAGAKRTIVNMDNRGLPHDFETFGPKAFAGIKVLPEDLMDRVILIGTVPAGRQLEPVVPNDPILGQLRVECYRWALLNLHKMSDLPPMVDPFWPGLMEYVGRQRDLWLPIECMMEALEVPEEDREAARDYYRRSQSSTKAQLPEDKTQLLLVLQNRVGDKEVVRMRRSELVKDLNPNVRGSLLDADPEWTSQKVGKQIKSLGILLGEPHRIDKNSDREYVIDGGVVRELCERYGLTE